MRFSLNCKCELAGRAALCATVAAVALIALADLSGCGQPRSAGPYSAVFSGAATAGGPASRGALLGDYRWAASAPTWDEAAARWREFLARHAPPGGEYQDNFQKLHVNAAQIELARVLYVLGSVRAGDEALLAGTADLR